MTTITWEHDVRVKLYWNERNLYLNGIGIGYVWPTTGSNDQWFSALVGEATIGVFYTKQEAMDATIDLVLKLLLKSDT